MSPSKPEECGRVATQAMDWLTQPVTAAYHRQCLRWLLRSPLHVREAALAVAWDEEIRRCLDPEHRLDVESFIERATET